MIITKFHFFNNTQNNKHRIFAENIMGKAMPIKEKKAVLRGDTYHAGKDKKSNKMDTKVITTTIAFIIFSTIVIGGIIYLPLASNS